MKRYRVRTQTRNVIRQKRERTSFPRCAVCKQPMHGTTVDQDAAKTEKHPSRAYGGYMCALCSREFFRQKARNI